MTTYHKTDAVYYNNELWIIISITWKERQVIQYGYKVWIEDADFVLEKAIGDERITVNKIVLDLQNNDD